MANFEKAFSLMMKHEGGYRLTNISGDRGGQTYAGISRTRWPEWAGWKAVDAGGVPITELIRGFYKENFWNPLQGDSLNDQTIANSLFSFGVNTGPRVSAKLAQLVVGAEPDGTVGEKTLHALNTVLPTIFHSAFAIAKITRYRYIVSKDRSQLKFLLGWINRTLEDLP